MKIDLKTRQQMLWTLRELLMAGYIEFYEFEHHRRKLRKLEDMEAFLDFLTRKQGQYLDDKKAQSAIQTLIDGIDGIKLC